MFFDLFGLRPTVTCWLCEADRRGPKRRPNGFRLHYVLTVYERTIYKCTYIHAIPVKAEPDAKAEPGGGGISLPDALLARTSPTRRKDRN